MLCCNVDSHNDVDSNSYQDSNSGRKSNIYIESFSVTVAQREALLTVRVSLAVVAAVL